MSAGVQVFGISFVQHIVVSQLSRTGLANALMTPSRAVVEKLGYKSTQTIVNGIRALAGKPAIGGAAASKQLAKMLRSNVVTAAVTFAFFSIPDTYKLALGRASGAQYAHNMVSLAASIAGGAGGAAVAGVITAKAAGAAGTAVAPGVGTAVGIAGGFVGGVAVGAIANAASGILYEGDGATIGRLFNAIVSAMAVEYMLDAGEIEALVELIDNTSSADFQYLLEEVFAAEEQEDAVRSFLTPRFDEVVLRRARFMLPEDSIVADALLGFMPDEKNEEILTSDRGISN